MLGNSQVRFGGGPEEKEPSYLACGLPYDIERFAAQLEARE
jgi:hypothetical protein